MKKIIFASTLLLASGVTFAANQSVQNQGGFAGPTAANVMKTVDSALQANDDARVELTGHIVNSLGDEDYTFKDNTGQIVIEIDHHKWNGINVTPETNIVITGEVDKDWSTRIIDVDTVRLATK
ncbi:TPA: YgiW/YdeI family stress tolerance OB fold protein [Photobacterium damselae]